MGAIGTAATVGVNTYNLLQSQKQNNQNIKNLNLEYQNQTQKKKNLLNQQLATQRASLGSMGITSSKSALAVQDRNTQEFYDAISKDSNSYQQKANTLKNNATRSLLNSTISYIKFIQ